jgi:iron complex outermembrane receptor protein
VAELLPSTGVISTELEAEQGWNYEASLRYYLWSGRLRLEATGFYFRLNNALVQRRDFGGADFFVNAGDTKQKGIEFTADYSQYFNNRSTDHFSIKTDISVNHFRYGSFIKGADDFSGNKIPSVPSATISLLGEYQFANGLYLNASLYSASSIYLNDANTAEAEPYQLLAAQLGWKKTFNKTRWRFFAGADNLLDQVYSLGNDINAAAGRYYNAAARRNYYGGFSLGL